MMRVAMMKPEKVQKIMSICVGEGAADKRGEVGASEYAEDSKKIAEEYRERDAAGECFVHIRKQNSSNRDLRALNRLAKGAKFYKVSLGGKLEESVITNSAKLPGLISDSECRSTEVVVRELEKEVRGDEWETYKRGFEQHMLEEDKV